MHDRIGTQAKGIKGIKLFYLIFIPILLASGCNRYYAHEIIDPSEAALDTRSLSEKRIKALKNLQVTLVRRLPTDDELKLAESQEGFLKVLQETLNSEDFRASTLALAINDFEMGGTANGINYSEPANLATYLIVNNLDYRQLLLADYCINDSFAKVQCSSFASESQSQMYAAGALTTQGFLEKWQSAFNFRRTSKAFKAFACRAYPDEVDTGLAPEQLSTTVKQFNCTDCVPKCYDCHRNMNPRASLFYAFDRKGKFNTNPNSNPQAGEITVTDTGVASTVADLLVSGAKPIFHGYELANLKDYGSRLAESDEFSKCTTQRIVGRLFGLPVDKALPPDLEHFYQGLKEDNFKLKDFILRIATSPEFLGR
ncbi:MAG: hypothetical protein IPK68_11965 [Bdellovibrionales bacterium]|nr:hypothetical protein [Bdellovibrionales bacterium]